MEVKINRGTLSLVEGDITKQDTEAIVNAANKSLRGGGGVDGAIHRAGGPRILEECIKIGGCETGEAVITTGGDLKARYVIHTVGPIYKDGRRGEPKLLENAYMNSLKLASSRGIKTIAFPSISTGAYGYPLEEAAKIALKTAINYLKEHSDIELIRFVLFGEKTYRVYEKVLKDLI
jgi:O-acetyl-ADP-ribose deacetylase (regulator of RNase III)